MLLFDNIERTEVGPAAYAEGQFSYYNRSARPEVGRIRHLIERWLATYPEVGRGELISRMREDHSAFRAAFFELFLYHLLRALDHAVELHPTVAARSTRPDFAVSAGPGFQKCYVEAVVAAAESDDERKNRQAWNRIQDDLNDYRHPDFFFILARLIGRPSEHPPRSLLHRFLRDCLNGLTADDVARRIEEGEPIRRTLGKRLSYKGLRLELYPWPKSPGMRGDTSIRTVGGGPIEVLRSTAREAILSAIKTKAGRYGNLGLPYVIAVNCTAHWGVEEHEVREALFGREQIVMRARGDLKPMYDGEGAFCHRGRPTNTRVSAALICQDLAPHSIPRAVVRLYHHFAPKSPYVGPFDSLPSVRPDAKHLREQQGAGRSLGELFGLWPEWPYDSGDPRGINWKWTPTPS